MEPPFLPPSERLYEKERVNELEKGA